MPYLQTRDVETTSQQQTISEQTSIVKVNGEPAYIPSIIRFNTHPEPRLEVYIPQGEAHILCFYRHQRKTVCLKMASGLEIEVLVSSPITVQDEGIRLTAKQGHVPEVRERKADRLQFYVLNGPWLHLGQRGFSIDVDNTSYTGWEHCFTLPEAMWNVSVKDTLPHSFKEDYSITHQVTVRRSDHTSFSVKEGETIVQNIRLLFSIMAGRRCGVAEVEATACSGSRLAWRVYGGYGVSRHRSAHSVYANPGIMSGDLGIEPHKVMRQLLSGLLDLQRRTTDCYENMERAVLTYTMANADREMVTKTILTRAVVEILASGVLFPKCDRKKVFEQARKECNIPLKVPKRLSDLRTIAYKHGKLDAMLFLKSVRDHLVHAKPDCIAQEVLDNPLAHQEACDLGLWYVEVMLLRALDYQLPYWNRLTCNHEEPPWL